MGQLLLLTKLSAPAVRPDLVVRERLLDVLEAGMDRRLVVLSAPAGFGKTTLIGQWRALRGHGKPLGWLSLDEADNDPMRFWAYLIAALQSLRPQVGGQALELLRSQQGAEAALTALVNDLASLTDDLWLVLDDYHLVTNEAVHRGVAFLVDHAPPRFHLVMTTRVDPQLPLSRLRARGQVCEVRAADLRFAGAEVAQFLNDTMGLGLTPADAEVLGARTEGWAAGLQLAALSLQGRPDRSAFIRNFTGNDRYVVDYLVEEVLQRQPEQVRSFLLETAVLNRLCSDLCDAVTGRQDGQSMLEELERASLFVVPLDTERRWYRYHQLFAEVLRHRLRRTDAGRLPDLHRKAAAWYERNGQESQAVEHWLGAGDLDEAASLIGMIAWSVMNQGQIETLQRWMKQFPQERLHTWPALCVAYAWSLIILGEIDKYEALLRAAEGALAAEEEPGLLAQLLLLRANWCRTNGDGAETVRLADLILALPNRGGEWQGMALLVLGDGQLLQGNLQAGESALEEARLHFRGPEGAVGGTVAIHRLGDLRVMQARLREAEACYRQAIELCHTGPVDKSAGPEIELAALLVEWNRLAEAELLMQTAIAQAEQAGQGPFMAPAYLHQTRLLRAHGDLIGARRLCERAAQIAGRVGNQDLLEQAQAHLARLDLSGGQVASAELWSKGVELPGEVPFSRMYAALTAARVMSAAGRPAEGGALAEKLRLRCEERGWRAFAIEALLIEAIARQAAGDRVAAVRLLKQALAEAEPAEYIRLFAEEQEALRPILAEASRTVSPAYAGVLLAAVGQDVAPRKPEQPLVESLSERECEVMRLVAAGRSNPEIAEALYISVGTVKVHLKNIFGKLGATNRVHAIELARQYHLI